RRAEGALQRPAHGRSGAAVVKSGLPHQIETNELTGKERSRGPGQLAGVAHGEAALVSPDPSGGSGMPADVAGDHHARARRAPEDGVLFSIDSRLLWAAKNSASDWALRAGEYHLAGSALLS